MQNVEGKLMENMLFVRVLRGQDGSPDLFGDFSDD